MKKKVHKSHSKPMKKSHKKEHQKEHTSGEHESKKSKSSKKVHHRKPVSKLKESPKAKAKVEKVMHEFKEGDLHSGSKKGPVVSNPKQAIAIALNSARKRRLKVSKKKSKK